MSDAASPAPGPGGFWRAVRDLPQNPLAQREWRGLLHQSRDWRLWVGLRIPKDARGWGVPAVVWFSLAPYIVLGALHLANRVAPGTFRYPPEPGIPHIDALALCMVLLCVYIALLGVALMAPTLTRERERETWESLRTTIASPHDIVLGLLAGRLGPVLAAHLLVGLVWVLLRPHYAPQLQSVAPFTLDQPQIALLVWLGAAATLALSTVAAAASAHCRSTAMALVLAAAATFVFAFLAVIAAVAVGGPLGLLALSAAVTLAAYGSAVRGVR
jgi:ABC-type Na+ efflux pump permease subunit